MRKNLLIVWAIVLMAGLGSCVKDSTTRSYVLYKPVYKEKTEVYSTIVGSKAAKNIEVPGKLYVYDNYLFINELNKGIHIIDNSNPAAPVNKAFIEIPGNLDIAVKGNTLYADLYSDLLSFDISDPSNAKLLKTESNVFPDRAYINGFIAANDKIIVDWIRVDTTVNYEMAQQPCWNCGIWFDSRSFSSMNAVTTAKATSGVAGSMARFSIVNNHMYTVNSYALNVFNITNEQSPLWVKKNINVGMLIETIYPFQDKLFIGSGVGMHIYDISNAAEPVKLSSFTHARACDPVVTDGDYAYVTLRTGTTCATAGIVNSLEVIDVKNLSAPSLLKKYNLTNPSGLAKVGNDLWICDGKDGLKLFDATKPADIQLKNIVPGIQPYDVIPVGNRLIVSANEGIIQLSYNSAGNKITELSRIKAD